MSSRIFARNAFETGLDGGINDSETTITLDSAVGLGSPGILVFNDDSPTLREYVEYTGISSNDLTGCTRGLTGSAGGIPHAHGTGARVRSVYLHQIQDRIWDDVEALEAVDTAHVAASDPHTVYLKEAGGIMTGKITLDADPTAVLHAASKQYVDGGGLLLPTGTRLIFDQDAAPTGWTRDVSTVDDKVIRIVTGARADGGTWTQPNHTHTQPTSSSAGSHAHTNPATSAESGHTHTGPSHTHTGPSHTHTNPTTGSSTSGSPHTAVGNENGGPTFEYSVFAHAHLSQGPTGAAGTGATSASGTGSTGASTGHTHTQGGTGSAGAHAHGQTVTDGGATAASWRPLHRDMIIAVKD